jgi:hypothetical protein
VKRREATLGSDLLRNSGVRRVDATHRREALVTSPLLAMPGLRCLRCRQLSSGCPPPVPGDLVLLGGCSSPSPALLLDPGAGTAVVLVHDVENLVPTEEDSLRASRSRQPAAKRVPVPACPGRRLCCGSWSGSTRRFGLLTIGARGSDNRLFPPCSPVSSAP